MSTRRRRRNPQAGEPPPPSLMRKALIQHLDNDFRPRRIHHWGSSKTWNSGLSDDQVSSPVSSRDRYVKAILDDKRPEGKDPFGTPDAGRPSRNHTPGPGDVDIRRASTFPELPRISRRKERWASVTDGGRRVADQQHRLAHHEPWTLEIRGQQGNWRSIQVTLEPSSTRSAMSEDVACRLGLSLNPMPPGISPFLMHPTLSEPEYWADVQVRISSSGMPPVSTPLAITEFLPGGSDMILGQALFNRLFDGAAVPSVPTSPIWSSWAGSGPSTSASSTKDGAVSTSEDGAQPDDTRRTWLELYDPIFESSSSVVHVGDEGREVREWSGDAFEAFCQGERILARLSK